MAAKNSGQPPFAFEYCPTLRTLPPAAVAVEAGLHGGFAVDRRPERGEVYYGVAGCGLMRVSADLAQQDVIELPDDLRDVNFHSTKIGEFDGKARLFLPANENEMVVVVDLDGRVEFVLPRPEFEQYRGPDVPFNPTDTALHGEKLFVADGYGANYILTADVRAHQWTGVFAGRTDDPVELGKFGTAHGLNRTPSGRDLSIADRPHSRFEICTLSGHFHGQFTLPNGSRPCGIDFRTIGGRDVAVVASLDDPEPSRAAPIYVLDARTYEVLSTIRPKEELGIELADHIHNVVWHEHDGRAYLVAQAWNPGFYFVLGAV